MKMKIDMNTFSGKVAIFFALGIGLVLAVLGLAVMAYLVFWGAIVGGLLFLANAIKNRFFPAKQTVSESTSGRIIEIKVKSKSSN